MPKIFEYLGILIFFYSNEHEPIHVHARKGEFESRATIVLVEGKINKVIISNVKGRQSLKGKDLKNFREFMTHYSEEIVEKWVDYFVYHKKVNFRKISKLK